MQVRQHPAILEVQAHPRDGSHLALQNERVNLIEMKPRGASAEGLFSRLSPLKIRKGARRLAIGAGRQMVALEVCPWPVWGCCSPHTIAAASAREPRSTIQPRAWTGAFPHRESCRVVEAGRAGCVLARRPRGAVGNPQGFPQRDWMPFEPFSNKRFSVRPRGCYAQKQR